MTDVGGSNPQDFDDTGSSMEGLDLTPRKVAPVPGAGSRRKLIPTLLLVAVLGGMGFVLFRTLGDAALFFYNADQAVERRDELADQRFRLQGTPFGDAVTTEITRDGRAETAVVFPVQFDGVTIDVVHIGSPAELFQPGVPVVLEGAWVQGLPQGIGEIDGGSGDGWHFASTDMVVKHDNEYRNDNRERLDDAEQGGTSTDT